MMAQLRFLCVVVAVVLLCATVRGTIAGGGKECLATIAPQLEGFIAWPGTSIYNNSIAIDNGAVHKTPLAVVFPLTPQDVSITILAAQKCNLQFAAKNGGHSAAGYCLNDGGVVLDVSYMNESIIDATTGILTQRAGGVWTYIYDNIMASKSGWVPVGGGCPTVGVSGFTSGGGYSFLSRSYGLAIDNLLSVTLVLANGSIITVGVNSNTTDEQQLFWALRGGGGGNFGVIVSMDFQMHRPSPTVLWGEMCWPVDQSTAVLTFYNGYSQLAPDNLSLYGWFGHRYDQQVFCFTVVYNGDYTLGLQTVQPLLAFNPPYWTPHQTSFLEFEKLNGNATLVSHRNSYIKSGMILPGGLTAQAIKIFQNAIKTAPSKNSSILWDHAGGAIARVGKDATAFAHRDAAYVYEVKSIWDTPDEAQKNLEWIHQLGKDIAPYLNGAYLNYIDPLLPNWSKEYYGAHYPLLVSIKQKWDPTNFFTFKQSIGSPYEPPQNTSYPY